MFKLPELNYAYEDLEPAIGRDIMQLHHQKHHQAYVDKLNSALEDHDDVASIEGLLQNLDKLPGEIRQTVRNNGGGHFNHSLFWQMMSGDGGGEPGGELAKQLTERYQSFGQFVEQFSEEATGLFGSGWVWLMPNLDIVTTANQDNPLMQGQPVPILGLDVWEHAYYLDYKNQRDSYIKAWWDVVNWPEVEKRYASDIIS